MRWLKRWALTRPSVTEVILATTLTVFATMSIVLIVNTEDCSEPEFPEVESTDLGYRINYGIAQRHWRLCKEGLATSNDTCMKAFWYLRVPEEESRRHFRSEVSNEMKDIYEGVDPTVTTLDEFKTQVFPKIKAYEMRRRLLPGQYKSGR